MTVPTNSVLQVQRRESRSCGWVVTLRTPCSGESLVVKYINLSFWSAGIPINLNLSPPSLSLHSPRAPNTLLCVLFEEESQKQKHIPHAQFFLALLPWPLHVLHVFSFQPLSFSPLPPKRHHISPSLLSVDEREKGCCSLIVRPLLLLPQFVFHHHPCPRLWEHQIPLFCSNSKVQHFEKQNSFGQKHVSLHLTSLPSLSPQAISSPEPDTLLYVTLSFPQFLGYLLMSSEKNWNGLYGDWFV